MDTSSLYEGFKLLLAAWGAGLSTFLAIRQARERRRQVRVFLTHVWWIERAELAVVNVGHRPVTIVEVGVRPLPPPLGDQIDPFSFKPFWPETSEKWAGPPSPSLPVVLKDGEQARFIMEDRALDLVHGAGDLKGYGWVAFARDAELIEYTTNRELEYDAKYGQHMGYARPPRPEL